MSRKADEAHVDTREGPHCSRVCTAACIMRMSRKADEPLLVSRAAPLFRLSPLWPSLSSESAAEHSPAFGESFHSLSFLSDASPCCASEPDHLQVQCNDRTDTFRYFDCICSRIGMVPYNMCRQILLQGSHTYLSQAKFPPVRLSSPLEVFAYQCRPILREHTVQSHLPVARVVVSLASQAPPSS